jgi:hypothetical protein
MMYDIFFDSGLTQGTTEQQVDGASCSKDSQDNSGKKGSPVH